VFIRWEFPLEFTRRTWRLPLRLMITWAPNGLLMLRLLYSTLELARLKCQAASWSQWKTTPLTEFTRLWSKPPLFLRALVVLVRIASQVKSLMMFLSNACISLGLSIHNIRASHSYIKGTNGTSNGLVPMLRVFNDTARYVDQGGGYGLVSFYCQTNGCWFLFPLISKRKGAFSVYLEPWHADVFEFLELKKPHGKEETRARDLFYALWYDSTLRLIPNTMP